MSMFRNLLIAQNLPYKRRLAYLEGTGTQYLDTGVVADVNTEMELGVVPTSSSAYLGGSIDAINTRQYGMNLSGNGQITLYYGTVSSAAYTKRGGSWGVGTPTTLKIGAGGKLSQDGTVIVDYTDDPNITKEFSTSTIRLFYFFGSFGAFRLRYCRIRKSGVLARDFIPVLDLNGVPCMYDQVTGQFFYNAGTGSFIPSLYPVANPRSLYVTDGLTLMLDGIANGGSVHDAQATTWKDLSGRGKDFVKEGSPIFTWGSDHIAFSGNRAMLQNLDVAEDGQNRITVEVVFEYVEGSIYNWMWIFSCRNPLNSDNNRGWQVMFNGESNKNAGFLDGLSLIQPPPVAASSALSTFALTFDGNALATYNNATPTESAPLTDEQKAACAEGCAKGDYYIGKCPVYDLYNTFSNVYAIRVYNRALTQSEITHNHLADKARFNF